MINTSALTHQATYASPTRRWISQLLVASGVFLSRLSILPANVKPVGSYGFFGNPFLYGISILAFDLFIKGFYPGFWLTYLGFAMYPLLGFAARQSHHSTRLALIFIPLASFLFFLLSNLGVWYYWYPHTVAGLATCFLLALPFYTRTLLSDLMFGYGYLLWKERATLLRSCLRLNFALHWVHES